jgi:hypothetical protein
MRRVVAPFCVLALSVPVAGQQDPFFVNRAMESGIDARYFKGMTGELLFSEIMGGGAALLDFDGDGDLDIYLAQGAILRPSRSPELVFPLSADEPMGDRLWRNDTTTSPSRWPFFVDVTERAGVDGSGYGMGVAVGDFDADGWQDLYVLNYGGNRLLRNRGDGRFEDVTERSGTGDARWSTTATWFDYDDDGLLDLFVGNYSEYRLATHKECFSEGGETDYCGPGVYPASPDALFHNLGDGVFEKRSKRSGLSEHFGPALGSVAADFNADGRLDLYVANDGQPNQLWINRGDGTFVDEAVFAGVAVNASGQPEASMGVVAADFNADGREDLFMAHLTRETNTLYLGGDGFFSEASHASGLAMPSWRYTGFGVGVADFDLDGALDLFLGNGAVRRVEGLAQEHDQYPLDQPNQLFLGLGGGRFLDASEQAGDAVSALSVSRGVAVGDIDNDGDDDVLVVNSEGPLQLLENRAGDGGTWLGFDLRSRGTAPAWGAEVHVVFDAERRALRRVGTDGSYASARDARVRLAAAGSAEPSSFELRRAGGPRLRLIRPPSGHYLVLELR